jgi:hypothetical protein
MVIVVFGIGSHFCPWGVLDCIPSIYASCVAGMISLYHYTQLLVEMEFHVIFAWTVILLISASQVARQGYMGEPRCPDSTSHFS